MPPLWVFTKSSTTNPTSFSVVIQWLVTWNSIFSIYSAAVFRQNLGFEYVVFVFCLLKGFHKRLWRAVCFLNRKPGVNIMYKGKIIHFWKFFQVGFYRVSLPINPLQNDCKRRTPQCIIKCATFIRTKLFMKDGLIGKKCFTHFFRTSFVRSHNCFLAQWVVTI